MLVSGPYGPEDQSGIWIFPTTGDAPKQVFAGDASATLSPDDSQVAFLGDGGAIWTMSVSGGVPRRIISPAPGYRFGETIAWSPDGSRIAFTRQTHEESALVSCDLKSAGSSVILSDPKMADFCWSRDGQIVFARQEDEPNQGSTNLWAVTVDHVTGMTRGKPRRLTDWGGSLFDGIKVNARGTLLSAVRKRFRSSIYVGELQVREDRILPKRFTFDAWINLPTAWTSNGRSLLFTSDRNGKLDIFQQNPDAPAPIALVAGAGERKEARPSPDGAWILYMAGPDARQRADAGLGRVMRIARAGTSPQLVLQVAGYPRPPKLAWAGTEPGETLQPHPGFRCPSVPGSPCVLSERIGNEVVFTAFDPVKGRQRELARVPESSASRFWNLSPDGHWIVTYKSPAILLISLAGHATREIRLGRWRNLLGASWAADGKSLFATAWASKDPPVLRVSLDGAVTVLHTGLFHASSLAASPDGRYLAFTEDTMESNVWVVENFR